MQVAISQLGMGQEASPYMDATFPMKTSTVSLPYPCVYASNGEPCHPDAICLQRKIVLQILM
jgi:hypothetical protein